MEGGTNSKAREETHVSLLKLGLRGDRRINKEKETFNLIWKETKEV